MSYLPKSTLPVRIQHCKYYTHTSKVSSLSLCSVELPKPDPITVLHMPSARSGSLIHHSHDNSILYFPRFHRSLTVNLYQSPQAWGVGNTDQACPKKIWPLLRVIDSIQDLVYT